MSIDFTAAHAGQRPLHFGDLVSRLVPLFAELFATLAARDPLRMRFADVAGRTVLDIVETLREDGLSQEAIAASLDLTMTGFRAKVKRLSSTLRAEGGAPADAPPSTLLQRLHRFVADHSEPGGPGVRFHVIESAFRGVRTDSLKGVLYFLVQSGLLSSSGRGAARTYAAVARTNEAEPATWLDAAVLLHHEGPMTVGELAAALEVSDAFADTLLDRIDDEGLITPAPRDDGDVAWAVTGFTIPVDATEGYEAALWDHVGAVCRAICHKVRRGRYRAGPDDANGGTTFSFDLPVGHPVTEEILGFLPEMRARMDRWQRQTEALREVEGPRQRVVLYSGQMCEDAA